LRMELHLESMCAQSVKVRALDLTLRFWEGERIHTENSYKYTLENLENLLQRGGFRVEHVWTDPNSWFAVSLAVVI
jgi:L-histidine N-alpha-methyltransferase